MAEPGPASTAAGVKFLAEVQRLLDVSAGMYLCVTLAQPHVLRQLLGSFCGAGWACALHKPPPSLDMARSPLQPFLAILRRAAAGSAAGSALVATAIGVPRVSLEFAAGSTAAPDAEHVAEVIRVRGARACRTQ